MKNRRTGIVLIMFLLVLSGMVVIACGPPSPVVGKWQHTEKEIYYEFFSNGKYEYSKGDETDTGRYTEYEHQRLILISDDERSPFSKKGLHLQYMISDNELLLWDLGPNDGWAFTRVE